MRFTFIDLSWREIHINMRDGLYKAFQCHPGYNYFMMALTLMSLLHHETGMELVVLI